MAPLALAMMLAYIQNFCPASRCMTPGAPTCTGQLGVLSQVLSTQHDMMSCDCQLGKLGTHYRIAAQSTWCDHRTLIHADVILIPTTMSALHMFGKRDLGLRALAVMTITEALCHSKYRGLKSL